MPFDRVAILGTGLIGASVGLAWKAARPSALVVGFDQAHGAAREAQKAKAIDRAERLGDAVKGADLVVLATPVGAMPALLEEIVPFLRPGAVVMDTGSTKGRVLEWAAEKLPSGVHFVGGHPMAGKTDQGPGAADVALFRGAVWCLAPLPSAAREAVEKVISFVEGLGATPYFVDAEEHDGLVASISHLPYLMSVALITHLGEEKAWRESASLAAGGFAYTTHLTDSDPQMFADIMRTNRQNIARRLDLYIAALESLRDKIEADDPALKNRFEQARQLHQDWLTGRAQGLRDDGAQAIPTTRSMLTGGLFGRLGERKKE